MRATYTARVKNSIIELRYRKETQAVFLQGCLYICVFILTLFGILNLQVSLNDSSLPTILLLCSLLSVLIFGAASLQTYVAKGRKEDDEAADVTVDYTNTFIIFAFMYFGTLGGLFILCLVEFITLIYTNYKNKTLAQGFFYNFAVHPFNISVFMLNGFLTNSLLYICVGVPMWVTSMLILCACLIYDFINMHLAVHLVAVLTAYRTSVRATVQKINILETLATNYMYYIYLCCGPLIIYYATTWAGLVGFIISLIVLIPSQQVGLLYMQLQHRQAKLFTDELTGISNSIKFRVDMETQLVSPNAYSLIMFDLDKFKGINDNYGHTVGDEALCAFANLLQNIQDTYSEVVYVYRLHGDEYVMYIKDIDKTESLVTELNKLNTEFYLKRASDIDIKLSYSGGATNIAPNTNVQDAKKKADAVLYQVKQGGRGRVLYLPNAIIE